MGIDLLFIIFLILLNAFFVAAEFSIVKVRSSQIEIKIKQGSSQAKVVQHILGHLDRYLSATQFGITVCSLTLGVVGEPYMAEVLTKLFDKLHITMGDLLLQRISFVAGIAIITIFHMVLGEQVPKFSTIRYPLQVSLFIAIPLRVFYTLFAPFIWVIKGLTNGTLRLFGLHKKNTDDDIHTEEELRMLLTESEEGGAIKQSEHELIQNVFEFDDRNVKSILIPRVKISAIDLDLEPNEILDKVIDEGYSRMPVFHDSLDNIIGIIYSKDLLRLLKHGKMDRVSLEGIIRPAHFIPQTKRINDLLREFQTLHIQMAIVTNEFGGIAGLVTMEDVIEELVGEIQDEYDEEKPAVEKKSDREFIVNAMATINDVNDVLPIALPESKDYETVSGLVNYLFGRIPAVNEKKQFGGYEFLILKRFKHSVETVKMTVLEENQQYNTEENS
ncbi:MAG TPA: hemolysin family protein [Bacteroidia bacterium]|jgi:CBS domain containing-hemolysin-like protein|nr:hemolysin family protein [Bacteroidia bacterium]